MQRIKTITNHSISNIINTCCVGSMIGLEYKGNKAGREVFCQHLWLGSPSL